MDAYHDQRRFPGSGEAPPRPHASHPNTQWYAAPPPPYPPHPGHPYPPQHHQWGPPPAVQHQHHPPPQPYVYQQPPPPQPYAYQPPPPAPGNPWPPHHAVGQPPPPSYPPPPPGQAWTNHSWASNPGYPGHGNEEDWATKAKAWAATKSVTENHQMKQHAISTSRIENRNHGYPDHYQQQSGLPTEVTEHLHPPVLQSSNDHVPFPMTGQQRDTNHSLDSGSLASPARNFGSFPSTYEQEVSYNYSSASGNGNAMLQYPSSKAQPFPSAAAVQDGFPQASQNMPVVSLMEQPPFGHERPSVDPSDQPLEFNRFHSRPSVPLQAAQIDPSVHGTPLFGGISGTNYVPPAAFSVGTVSEVFPTDPNIPFNAAEKSKKPPVPNWLREELLKKKTAPLSASTQHLPYLDSRGSNDIDQPLRRPDQSDSRSNDSAMSAEDDEDDEDEIEAARTEAINQEIKRVLTEVLLKVTDDLFDEIATKVLNEDDSSDEFNQPTISALKEPIEPKTKISAKVVLPAKPSNNTSSNRSYSIGLSSRKGALLGLSSYNSDDDDDDDGDDKPVSNTSFETNAGTADPEKYFSPGSTAFGDVKSVDKNTKKGTNVEIKHEHIHNTHNGEIPLDTQTFAQPTDTHKIDKKAHRHLEKSSKDLVKEVKADHTKELESSKGEKYNSDGKYNMYEEKGSIKENRGSDAIPKHKSDTKDPHSSVTSKRDDGMGDRKDTIERNRDASDRRGSKGKDEKEDRSRRMAKNSTSHSSRRSRSRSPRGRSRSRKESVSHGRGSISSDEPFDNKRKLHSLKNSMSPSPPKSRNRRVSRSPHSKHSHRRHSPYSSANRKRRSRSRSPVKRR